jgi:hypothetical protein
MRTIARILLFALGIALLYMDISGLRNDMALSSRGKTAEVVYASVTEAITTKDGKAPKEGEKSKSLGFSAKVSILDPNSETIPGLPPRLQKQIELPSVPMPEPILQKLHAKEMVFVEYLPDNLRVARFPGYKLFSWSDLFIALLVILISMFPSIVRPALWLKKPGARP